MPMAWIENERIRDIAPGDPAALYHPDVAALYDTLVPGDAAAGDGWVDGVLVKPEPPAAPPEAPPVAQAYPRVSPVEFKLLFTGPERVAIKQSTDPLVVDFLSIVDDPRLTVVDLGLASTQQGVAYLASVGLIGEARVAEILAGVVQ